MHRTPIKTIGYVTDVIEISYWNDQLPLMMLKRSHHLVKLLILIGVSIKQRISLQSYHMLTMKLILWLIKPLSFCKIVLRICEITVTLDFIFRLVLYNSEDVSFKIICLTSNSFTC